MHMEYEWDREKARANLEKHFVDFADAAGALENPPALTLAGPDSDGKERFVTLGRDYLGRLVSVVWTPQGKAAVNLGAIGH